MKYIYSAIGIGIAFTILFLISFLSHSDLPSDFMPHRACYYWRTEILGWSIGGNLLTFISYMIIPLFIIKFIKSRNLLPHKRSVGVLFAMFIISCGIGHAVNISTIFTGAYEYSAVWDSVVGIISIITMTAVIEKYPEFEKMPTIMQVREQYKVAELHRMASIDGVLVHNGGVISEINDVALSMFNMTYEQATDGPIFSQILKEEDIPIVMKYIIDGREQPYSLNIYPIGSKEPLICMIRAREVYFNGEQIRVTIIRDISKEVELKMKIERLQHSVKGMEELKKMKDDIINKIITKK